jgi:C_GCAxxG_C_C family probable redox protein
MNVESKQYDTASKIMEERRGNCAQAILATYGPRLSLGKVDCDSCMRIASAFGGGINRTGNVCGAITGALIALGLKYGKNIQDVTEISTQFLEEFIAINGSIICRELIGHDLLTDEDLRKASTKDVFMKCMKYVDDAAHLLEKYLEILEIKEGNQL